MKEYIQVVTTIDNRDTALKIADELVKKRLAGCVQVMGPITSTYWWNDKIESSSEWQIVIKTGAKIYKKIEKAIKELHPYETPEIIALPIIDGSKDYLNWLGDTLEDKNQV